MQLYDWDHIKADQITPLYSRKVAFGDNVTVARLEAKSGAATRIHSHPYEEVIVVLKGKWRFLLPSGEVVLEANQMLKIPPGMEHGSEVLEDAVAIDVCSPARTDWLNGDDRVLHYDPEQYLWAV
jgi:quercetin dioxygenase-like cupin family protein